MTVESKKILEQIKPEDKKLLPSEKLIRKFGQEGDCVELHIYDLNGNLLDSIYDFQEYEIPDINDTQGYYSEITFNPDKVLRNLGYNKGKYDLRVNFHRKKISNEFENIFYIDTISPSRTELKVKLKNTPNLPALIFNTNQFIAELGGTYEGIEYFKDFALNLGNDIILTGVNLISEPNVSNSFLIKLYEKLPNSYSVKTQFRIVEELTNPISYKVDLGVSKITVETNELRGPNLRIDTRLNSSIPTAYKSYNDILSYTSSGSLNNTLNALSSSIPISVEYDNPNTDSGYVYDKFIHFSSAEERLRNFKYKLELIELYTSRSAYINGLNPTYTTSIGLENENLKNKVIQDFDNWERYLYYDSGAYSWPKSNTTKPYNIFPTTSSEATNWFNDQIENAIDFDGSNPYILRNALPQYIIDNNENEQFVVFVDMMGQYFDNIWLYIENITDKNIAHNNLNEGISKELVFNALKEKGIPAFNQFENSNLFEYLIGSFTGSDSFQYQAPQGQTMVSGSNNGSIPKGDITKQIWKRLYHNAPYLLKTKGTERGVKALLACYGIPESMLHVKEYGGPLTDKSGYRTFKYPKATKALEIKGINDGPYLEFGLPPTTPLDGDPTRWTAEFTVIPNKVDTNIIFGDLFEDTNKFIRFYTSSIYPQAGTPDAGDGIESPIPDLPLYTGRPITIFITPDELQGSIYPDRNNKFLVDFYCYVDNQLISASKTIDLGERPSFEATENYRFCIGSPGTPSSYNISSSFSVQHFKLYTNILEEETKQIHTKDPSIIAANGTSSYFGGPVNLIDTTLYFYNPLGGNLKTETITNGYEFINYSFSGRSNPLNLRCITDNTLNYVDVTYDHYTSTPDTVGVGMVSEKIRYDMGTIDDNILSPTVRAEASALDRQPQDFSNLGVFFSPTFEINEDIIYTLGGFRLDDYIGDPKDLDKKEYTELKNIRKYYAQKIDHRYNFWEYIKLIQYFDHTIFKIIEEFVPAKANLKTGLVIEPHYLERNKFSYTNTDFSNIEAPTFNIAETQPSVESEYILNETTINIEEVLDGSGGSFENNFVYSKLSNKYYRVSENRG